MRKESKVMKHCTLMYKGLNIDRTAVLHKTKLLLKIYRPVVWSTSNRAYQILVRAVRCMYKPQLQRLFVNVDLQAQGKALSLEVKL